MATGCLSVPNDASFPGMETFQGKSWHTNSWPRDGVDFKGQRVAVIGTGSSAIQSIPVIAAEADHVTVFQRTPNFSIPAHNGPVDAEISADWKANRPFELAGWTADELAKMPTYYIMDLAQGMAETVATEMPSPAEIAANKWLTEDELTVYSGEYARTGFQGGLNWYRVRTGGRFGGELEVFAGRTVDVPAAFISGASDWGIRQSPGALDKMQKVACTNMKDVHLIEGAGHWVQQEQPDEVNRRLIAFLRRSS